MRIKLVNPTLLLYLSMAYWVPGFLNWLVSYESEVYAAPSSDWLSWLYVGLMFFIVIAFSFKIEPLSQNKINYKLNFSVNFSVKFLLVLLVVLFFFSALGYSLGLSSWRYSNVGLSYSLNFTTLVYVLAPSMLNFILFLLLFFRWDISPLYYRVVLFFIILNMALTATGIGPALAVLLGILTFIAPMTMQKIIFVSRVDINGSQIRKLPLWKLAVFFLLSGILAVVAFIVGESIKTQVDFGVLLHQKIDDIGEFLHYFLGRISVGWYSLLSSVYWFVYLDIDGHFDNVLAPILNAWYRFSVLTGGWFPIDRPIDGSLARINYKLINLYPYNDREGTTPGLIPSFLIAFPLWIAPFAMIVYLSIYHAIQKRLRKRMRGRPSWLGEVLILYFTMIFFSSPIDFLLIFDPVLVIVFFFLLLAFSFNLKRMKKRVQLHRM